MAVPRKSERRPARLAPAQAHAPPRAGPARLHGTLPSRHLGALGRAPSPRAPFAHGRVPVGVRGRRCWLTRGRILSPGTSRTDTELQAATPRGRPGRNNHKEGRLLSYARLHFLVGADGSARGPAGAAVVVPGGGPGGRRQQGFVLFC